MAIHHSDQLLEEALAFPFSFVNTREQEVVCSLHYFPTIRQYAVTMCPAANSCIIPPYACTCSFGIIDSESCLRESAPSILESNPSSSTRFRENPLNRERIPENVPFGVKPRPQESVWIIPPKTLLHARRHANALPETQQGKIAQRTVLF